MNVLEEPVNLCGQTECKVNLKGSVIAYKINEMM